VAAEGAILNEMLEIVAKRAALRPTASQLDLTAAGSASTSAEATGIKLTGQPHDHEESIVSVIPKVTNQNCNAFPISDLNSKLSLGSAGLRGSKRTT